VGDAQPTAPICVATLYCNRLLQPIIATEISVASIFGTLWKNSKVQRKLNQSTFNQQPESNS
jgi:hypothetical protein